MMLTKALLALVLVLSIEALPVPVSSGIPEYPADNISFPVNNNSLPVYNNSLPVNSFSIPARPELPGPMDVMEAINRDALPRPLSNNSLPVYNNSLPEKNNSFPMDINSLPVFNDSLPVYNVSRPANNMTIPVNNNNSLPTYNFSIPAPQELPISPRVMEEISREYLPRPVSEFQAMMNSLERTGGKFPFGVQKQERQDNPGHKSMDRNFKCYSGKDIVTVQQYFCSFALRVVKRPSEKLDCDMKYLVKSEPKFGDHENDLAFSEEETDGFQTIRVHCRCHSPLCNAEENFNQCMIDASHQKVYQNFTYNRNYNDLIMCIYKKTGRYPMQKQDSLHLNNAIVTSMKNNKMMLPMCYFGSEIVQATDNYCGLVLRIFDQDLNNMDCDVTSKVDQGPFKNAKKDLVILEENLYGNQMIRIQCKCYTPLCNTKENLNRCAMDAIAKNDMYTNVTSTNDLRGLLKCFTAKKISDDGARMIPQESFRSIDGTAFASMKNGNGVSSSVEPMREHSDEWRAETAKDSNMAEADSAQSSDDSKNV